MWKRQVWGGSRSQSAWRREVQETAEKQGFPVVQFTLFLLVHTQLYSPFMGSILSHPTYILIVEEEPLIPSRSLPGYLQSKASSEKMPAWQLLQGTRLQALWSTVQLSTPTTDSKKYTAEGIMFQHFSCQHCCSVIPSLQAPHFPLLFLTSASDSCSLCVESYCLLDKGPLCTPSSLLFHRHFSTFLRLTLL